MLVVKVMVVVVVLVKMNRFRKYFGGRLVRFVGGLEVEKEGKRGF